MSKSIAILTLTGLAGFVAWGLIPRQPQASGAIIAGQTVTFTPDNERIYYQARANAVNTDSKVSLDVLFQKHGASFGVPWQLLKAVAMRESSLNPAAINEEGDGPGGRASRGLMQILTPNRLNISGWSGSEPVGGSAVLFDPDKNIYYGAQILKWNLETYGFMRGISIYNNWSQRNEPANGPFSNQYYVDDIVSYFGQFGGDVSAAQSRFGAGSKG